MLQDVESDAYQKLAANRLLKARIVQTWQRSSDGITAQLKIFKG
jgi:hypothetical protein